MPNTCNSAVLSATVIDAPGTSTANLYFVTGIVQNDGSVTYHSDALCTVTANHGAVVSCTGSPAANLAQVGATNFGLYVTADAGFQGAHILTKTTCQ